MGNAMTYQLTHIMRRIYVLVSDMHWGILLAIVLTHMTISAGLLALAGDKDLLQPVNFTYWYATTALTVGYGDLSPKTDGGKLAAAFFIMPGAIACFTVAIAKALEAIAEIWRLKRQGRGDYSKMKNLIVIVGYDPDHTSLMIDEIVADTQGRSEIVLYTRRQLEVADPRYRYVQGVSLTSAADLKRAGIAEADKIIIYTMNDDEALSAALAVTALNNKAHVVCYFRENDNAALLRAHCPKVEAVLSPSIELIVKALSDPGTTQLLAELASHTDDGATIYAMPAKENGSFAEMTQAMLKRDAILVAYAKQDEQKRHFDFTGQIHVGDRLFYIAKQRLI